MVRVRAMYCVSRSCRRKERGIREASASSEITGVHRWAPRIVRMAAYWMRSRISKLEAAA